MSTASRQYALPPMEVPKRDAGAGESHAKPLDTEGGWILRAIEEALAQVMNLKTAVDAMHIDRSQFRRAMNGDGHLSVARLGLLPESFWRALFYFIGNHFQWNFAVVAPVTRPLTDSERLEHALTAVATNHLIIREYARRAVNGDGR